MNENILAQFFDDIKHDSENVYTSDIDTNLIRVAENELRSLKIPYKHSKTNKNILNLFYKDNNPLRYVKGFYLNNSRLGNLICKDKFLTQRFLENAKIKTPIGQMFSSNQLNEAKAFVNESPEKSFVLKPVSMSMSLGTFLNVSTDNIENCWSDSFSVQKKYDVKNPRVLIQEQIQGLELRIIVLEGRIGSAVFRGPGNVVGNGEHTIKELINIKNAQREKHNYLKRNPLLINNNLLQNLESKNLTIDTILPEGDYCVLYSQSSIATGREVYEVSKYLDQKIFNQVLQAVTAIPGVHTAGVDIFVDNLNAAEGTIIEVNLNPALQLHYYPMTGDPSNPLSDIFQFHKIDRDILNDKIDFDSLSKEDFSMIMERYKYLYNKQKKLSHGFRPFLKL